MANYLPYTSQIDARQGNANTPLASADAFGAGVGRAVEGLGQQLGNTGNMLENEAERRRREQAASAVAQSDFTAEYLKLQQDNDPTEDPTRNVFKEKVTTSYRDWVAQQAQSITDDKTRKAYMDKMTQQEGNWTSRASVYEFSAAEDYSTQQANTGLSTLSNRIQKEPLQYDMLVEQGKDILNARGGLSQMKRTAMLQNWQYDAAKNRFDGRMANVNTVADIDAIAAELTNADGKGRDWQAEMRPRDYESLVNMLGNSRQSFGNAANTAARALLTQLKERTKDTTTLIDNETLTTAQEAARKSTDPLIQVDMARIMRDQQIIREGQRLTPAELRSQINQINGNPGMAYPDMPAEIADDVSAASQAYGLPVDFTGGKIMSEYGANLKRNKPDLSKFAPQSAHKDLDLRNVRTEVVAGLQQAGEALGQNLIVTKGAGSAGPMGVDVSTVGMSEQDKAKLAGALVDGGFTGISQYDTYLRVDMRSAVPQNFGTEENGKVSGGWTYLSPEIVKTLKDKGFAAGVSADVIKRNKRAEQGKIDYGRATDIKDENGNPTSSAVGVEQFTRGTWIQTMQDPTLQATINERFGIDVTKLKEDELLELRKDPRVSIWAGAAYAAKNKKTLEAALGRSVNSAELYMAHFMGDGGATTFLTGYKNQPNQSAAELMPSAAASNKPVFYRDPKGNLKDPANQYSVNEVYNNISRRFALSPSQVAFGDNQTRERMLKNKEAALANDPITEASRSGSHVITGLFEDGGFEARGATSRSVADYYNISMNEMKPFTEDEAAYIKKQLDEGNADKQIEIMASISSMGQEPAKAAMRQLEQKDPVFAHAGDLYLQGFTTVAGDIARGRKIINEDKTFAASLGASDKAIEDAFTSATGGALYNIDPATRSAIKDSAVAYWVAKTAGRGLSVNQLDEAVFKESLQYVLGGSKDANVLQDVNGNMALLPRGISGDEMETAFESMTIADYTRLSADGNPPRYVDGVVVDPRDIEGEVMMQAIGGGQYRLLLDDGSVLTTGERTRAGRAKDYIFVPDAKVIKEVNARPKSFLRPTDFTPPSIYGSKAKE